MNDKISIIPDQAIICGAFQIVAVFFQRRAFCCLKTPTSK
jgi:hypothetical protein